MQTYCQLKCFNVCRNVTVAFGLLSVSGSALKCMMCFPNKDDICVPVIENCNQKNACLSSELRKSPCMSLLSFIYHSESISITQQHSVCLD